MLTALWRRFCGPDKNYVLFLAVGVFLGIGQSVDGATLSNYLKENFHMLVLQRSALEFPRELPGFLVFLVVGSLAFLGNLRIAVFANILAAIGMFALGVIPADFTLALLFIFIYSMGQHVYMPLASCIGMGFAAQGEEGKKLGQQNAINNISLVVSSAVLWVLFSFVHISYTVSFTIGAISFLIGAILLLRISPPRAVSATRRFVFRREYGLYYWLSLLFGARKQIFITFGPWVLVDVFKQPVTTMTALFFIIAVTGIFAKPFVGRLIDTAGERFILCAEAAAFFFVCLGYVFADAIFSGQAVVVFICTCYVLDQTLGAVSMARATYLKKIALKPEDVSATLASGTSIDHVVSMYPCCCRCLAAWSGIMAVTAAINTYLWAVRSLPF